MNSFKSFLKNNGIIGVTQVLARLKGLIFLPLIAKVLGITDYGLWMQVAVTVNVIVPIASMGLGYTLPRYIPGQEEKSKVGTFYAVLLFSLGIATLISAGVMCVAPFIARTFFGGEQYLAVVRVIGLLIPAGVLNATSLNFFRATSQFKKYAMLHVLSEFITIPIVVVAVFQGYGILGAVQALFVGRLLAVVMIMVIIVRDRGFVKPVFKEFPAYLKFGIPLIITTFAYGLIKISDRYVISFFMGIRSVGYYSIGFALSEAVLIAAMPVIITLSPTIAMFWKKDDIHSVKRYLRGSLRYYLMLSLPVLVSLPFVGNKMLNIFSVSKTAHICGQLIPLISLGLFFYGLSTFFSRVFFLREKSHLSALTWGACGLLNIGANIVLVPRYGLMGAAVATMVSFFAANIICLLYAIKKDLYFGIPWVFALKSIIASLGMLFLISRIPVQTIAGLIGIIVSGVVLYGGLLFVVQAYNRDETSAIKDLLNRRVR